VGSFDEHQFDAPPLRHRACWQKSRPSAFAPISCDPPYTASQRYLTRDVRQRKTTTMKPNLNLDFARGVLFSYAAYNLYENLYGFTITTFFPGALGIVGIISAVFITGIYAGIAFALAFTPTGYARFVTIFFAVILITKIGATAIWAGSLPPGFPSPFNRFMISQLVIGILIISLSFVYQRALQNKKV